MADRVEILMRARGGPQVEAQTRQATRGLTKMDRAADRVNKTAGRLGSGLRSLGRGVLYTGAAAGGAALVAVKRGTDAWDEHRETVADVRQALKTTDGVANVSARHLQKRADAIQRMAAIDDDAVLSGERMLLTFKKVQNQAGKGNKIFDRGTRTAVDMAARFDLGLKPAIIQVGKALDDPVKGITALRRTGVSFTKSQIEQIKTLEDTGQHLKAQKLILRELDTQVKGSARAQATPVKALTQTWGDFEKELGRQVTPTLDDVRVKLRHVTEDATKIMGRRDISWTAKVKLFTRQDLEPEAKKLVAGLKRANLDEKLADAVEWAVPKMADAFVTAGPAAVKALVKGFNEAGPAGKLLIAWFTGKKLGLGKLALGGLLGGGKGGVKDTLLGRGSPGNPMWVQMVGKGLPGTDVPGTGSGKGGKGSKIISKISKAAPFLPVVGTGLVLGKEAYDAGASNWVGTPKRQTIKTDDLTASLDKLTAKLTGVGKGRPAGPQGARGASWINPKLIASSLGTATRNATRDLPGKTGKAVRDGTKPLEKLPARTGREVRDATKHLDRLPERVAGAVARRPQNVRIHNVIQMPDGRVLAEIVTDYPELLAGAVGRERGRNRERG